MTQPLVIAQISDSHLFGDVQSKHCGVNVYQNLLLTLNQLSNKAKLDYIIFTGDLSQDHSEASYRLFSEAIRQANISVPVLFIPGNHDEVCLLNKHLKGKPFCGQRLLDLKHWQLVLLNSKSTTPAGRVQQASFDWLGQVIDPDKSQLVFMHHHPIDVGYFIDRHGLENKTEFWQHINKFASIKAIACGHVHRALTVFNERAASANVSQVPLYTCPATSIQFDPNQEGVSALPIGPGYRLFYLAAQGQLSTDTYTID